MHLVLLVSVALAATSPRASATGQPPLPSTGIIRGVVTALGGEVALPDSHVEVERITPDRPSTPAVASIRSDQRGRFQVAPVVPGRYRVSASLLGFLPASREVDVAPGRGVDVTIDLPIEGTSEVVQVVPEVRVEVGVSLGSAGLLDFAQLETALAGDASISDVLPLLPGVIHGPAGVSIKGGRPTQSVLLVGTADFADPSTGESDFRLPSGAVDSLEVVPSPYAVEFGRFSAGVTLIEPRKGGDAWRFSLGGVNPSFRTKRGSPLTVIGVESFTPRATLGGPIVGSRLFLMQSAQFRFRSTDISSRPQDERTRTVSFGSFTRLDATAIRGHALTAIVGLFPESRRFATLGTFDPPEVTASTRRQAINVGVGTKGPAWGPTALEHLVHVKAHSVDVTGQGSAPMEFLPSSRRGNYFNDQWRDAWAVQWRSVLSGLGQHLAGTHFYRAGIDLVRSSFQETSAYRPVLIKRDDGSLARSVVFETPGRADAAATDVAVFSQDRWQPAARVLVDTGIRLDRDGVTGASTFSPRLGVRFTFGARDGMTLGGGLGRFVERTPLTLGTAEALAGRTITDFGEDGQPRGSAQRFAPRVGAAGLHPPTALTWHLNYDLRITREVSLRANVLDRRTTSEYVVTSEVEADTGWLSLDSRGRSFYRELAVGARYASGTRLVVDAAYVRSTGRADVNTYAAFLGTIRDPIVRANAYAPTETDAPNRVVAQFRGEASRWRMASTFEFRDGLPYSALNALQDYVGRPNSAGRLRPFASFDVIAERRLSVRTLRPWVGLQLVNGLGRFNPNDVQRNVDAADYGTMYNSESRRLRLTVRF